MQCSDKAKDLMDDGKNKSAAESLFNSCQATCLDDHVNLIPSMTRRIHENLQSFQQLWERWRMTARAEDKHTQHCRVWNITSNWVTFNLLSWSENIHGGIYCYTPEDQELTTGPGPGRWCVDLRVSRQEFLLFPSSVYVIVTQSVILHLHHWWDLYTS